MVTMIIASAISAIATVVIAIYAWLNHRLTVKSYQLSQELKVANDLRVKSDEGFRQQVSDLYQAITIATLISGPSSTGDIDKAINTFKKYYKGTTPIF